ncbi:MAG: hypothetical protein ACYDDF_14430 [Thermoplasmatota archaeon]
MAEAGGEYLLRWRSWVIWTLPVIATLYFIWVLAVFMQYVRTPSVAFDTWVNGGLALFVIIIVVELLLLIRRKPAMDAMAETSEEVAIPPYAAPTAPAPPGDAEVRATGEQYKGMKVVEVSLPPKSQNRGGIYAKAFVEVSPEIVLRVESLVAGREDVSTHAPNAAF